MCGCSNQESCIDQVSAKLGFYCVHSPWKSCSQWVNDSWWDCTLDMQIKTFPGLMNTFIDCDICVESTPLFLPSDRAPFNIGLLQSLKQYYSTVNNQPFVMLTLQKQCTSPSHPTLIWYQKKSGRGGGESGISKIDVKPLCIHSCFSITNLYYFSDVWELSIKLPTLFS